MHDPATHTHGPIAPVLPDRPVLARLDGVGIRRAGRWLIRDIDLVIQRGEIVSVIGPNGAGKTTTARALLGIEEPTVGTVHRTPGLTTGYVPQLLSVDRTLPLKVRHLMELTARFPSGEIEETLGLLGVAHCADSQVHTLSGGELRRVLMARALLRRPDLLVLDEPTQGLDVSGEVDLYEIIRSMRDRLDCGVLLISHDLHMVMAQTDQVVCVNGSGHVCCSGPPRMVADHQGFLRLFGRRTADALAFYRHQHDPVRDPAGDTAPGHRPSVGAGTEAGTGAETATATATGEAQRCGDAG
ncbi:MAG: metal ABC transporter ATP-binding protein [Rhodospirillaceae bacterium]|nr:metal ABC transporter ATP-binding protein [Rhodospirillaceae bacterium]